MSAKLSQQHQQQREEKEQHQHRQRAERAQRFQREWKENREQQQQQRQQRLQCRRSTVASLSSDQMSAGMFNDHHMESSDHDDDYIGIDMSALPSSPATSALPHAHAPAPLPPPSQMKRHPRRRRVMRRCCRKFVTFMCTQVGVGALIVLYAICGAFSFMNIEREYKDESASQVIDLRNFYATELWRIMEHLNTFDHQRWLNETDHVLAGYQKEIVTLIKHGYVGRTPEQIWSFPAALMFCLSVITMIGYGNMVPRTPWGKGFTVIYATFGIPLYILYFLNMGKVLAGSFKFIYRSVHDCTSDQTRQSGINTNSNMAAVAAAAGATQATKSTPAAAAVVNNNHSNSTARLSMIALENGRRRYEASLISATRKKIIVPTTSCLWVIIFYILTGTIMFANWEKWSFLNSFYFCMTSLCKIGFGDFVPGTSTTSTITVNDLDTVTTAMTTTTMSTSIKRINSQIENDNDAVDQNLINELQLITDEHSKLAINFIYMLIGMGLVAMCYNLMREEVRVKFNELREDAKLCMEETQMRFSHCCSCCGRRQQHQHRQQHQQHHLNSHRYGHHRRSSYMDDYDSNWLDEEVGETAVGGFHHYNN